MYVRAAICVRNPEAILNNARNEGDIEDFAQSLIEQQVSVALNFEWV